MCNLNSHPDVQFHFPTEVKVHQQYPLFLISFSIHGAMHLLLLTTVIFLPPVYPSVILPQIYIHQSSQCQSSHQLPQPVESVTNSKQSSKVLCCICYANITSYVCVQINIQFLKAASSYCKLYTSHAATCGYPTEFLAEDLQLCVS